MRKTLPRRLGRCRPARNLCCQWNRARLQRLIFTSLRVTLKNSSIAFGSGTAMRSGLNGLMPFTSSDLGSILALGKGSMCQLKVRWRESSPFSSMRSITAATSSNASLRQSKPPVSTSTTTGRKPRKRPAIGIISISSVMGESLTELIENE